ncbi:MAG: DUF1501 domain-containing protein [Pirellulaceae bacterium]|nr:DUF1501 domain-containing protein [Pirellulaceae bacterium]
MADGIGLPAISLVPIMCRMLTIDTSHSVRFCDGITRRQALQIGIAGWGGLTLGSLLRAEANLGRSTTRSVINIHLGGGPAHQETFDLKPDAPRECRGEARPIQTSVPGIEISDLLPRLAKRAHRLAILRALVGAKDDHSDQQTMTGFVEVFPQRTDRPAIGSVVDRLLGPLADGTPPFVSLGIPTRQFDGGTPGYLGPSYAPYRPDTGDVEPNDLRIRPLKLSAKRLRTRTQLLASLDGLRRSLDNSRKIDELDPYAQRALDVVLSGKVADALDLSQVSEATKQRYGQHGLVFLKSLRLAAAGVRVVNCPYHGWDYHENIAPGHRMRLPRLDQGISALIDDLYAEGLDREIAVVVWGDFGRSPRINHNAGRDHWPAVSMALMTGGGFQTGQVIGSTTSRAEEPKERPIHYQNVHATLYRHLGVDPSETLEDFAGRPQALLEKDAPIPELG